MSAAAAVTIIAAVLIVLALAAYLIAISLVLKDITSKLGVVIGAVGTIASKTEPVEPVVGSINRNLGAAKDLLNGLLVAKVGSQAAAEIIASVDPLGAGGNGGGAAAPAAAPRIQYGSGGHAPEPEPEPAALPGRAPAAVGHGATRLRTAGAAPADEGMVGHGATRLRTADGPPAAAPVAAAAPTPAAAPPAAIPEPEEPAIPGRITIRRKGFPGS